MTTDEQGQAATELALVVPFLVLLLLAVVQVTLVARDQVLVVHAAREAAREAAVGEEGRSGLKLDRLGTDTSQNGGVPVIVTVRVVYRAPTDVPLIGPLLPDVEVRAKATMRRESPGELGKSPTAVRSTAGLVPFRGEPSGEEVGRDPPH